MLGAAGSRPRGGWADRAVWGPPWGQRCRCCWELVGGVLAAEGEARVPGGSTHREMPKPKPTCPEETRGDSPPGVTTALMHAHARTRGEQMAGSLTQCVAAEASKSVAA